MSAPLQLNIIEQNTASGIDHQPFQASDIHALKTAYIEPGTDIQINAIQANQASGNNIQQGQFTDVEAVARALEANPNVGEVNVNLIQSNQASGSNIDQGQIADVNAHGGYPTNYGYSRNDDFYYSGRDHYYDRYADGDAQANVVQVNQAAGKNIDQFQFADVNAGDAFSGHNSFYDDNTIEGVVNAVQVNQASGHDIDQSQLLDVDTAHIGLDGWEDAVFLTTVI